MRFENKTVVVTGAASGIGRAIATGFGSRGAAVVAVDRDAPGLTETVQRIGAAASAHVVDRADPAAIAGLRDEAVAA
jgi:NADP-dependent 3-hydroxy acid dehydrogenase YdfG